MRCHTWPPAASAPHMGVRATMSSPPSPAPGWHILIHERAWALSGQNYPYQNATINTFITPSSKATPFCFSFKKQTIFSENQQCFLAPALHAQFPLTHTQWHLWTPYKRMHVLADDLLLQPGVIRLPVIGRGSAFLLLIALWAMNSVPQVLVSLSSDLLTQNTPNVNRSSQLITNWEWNLCGRPHWVKTKWEAHS